MVVRESLVWMYREALLVSLGQADIEIWSFEESPEQLGLSYMSPAIWVPGQTHMFLRNLVCKVELPYYLMSCESGGVKFNPTNHADSHKISLVTTF